MFDFPAFVRIPAVFVINFKIFGDGNLQRADPFAIGASGAGNGSFASDNFCSLLKGGKFFSGKGRKLFKILLKLFDAVHSA